MRHIFGSVARISDLPQLSFAVEPRPRAQWDTGDYVVCSVSELRGPLRSIELTSGRIMEVAEGDRIVGVLGHRAATLEVVGSWHAVTADLRMDVLTSAGLFGRITSKSSFLPWPMGLQYEGHVQIGAAHARMRDYVPAAPQRALRAPVVLVIGTSMSAGKTTAARIIIRELKRQGLRVVGTKLTGAARYRDILSMSDAGADEVFDFVDAGLPSTVCPADECRAALGGLLARMAVADPDVLVVEAGASPLEPYNGATAIDMIAPNVRCTVLCASDPYAVVGVMNAFERRPDLIAGGAANTQAGIALVQQLTGLRALNLTDPEALPVLRELLRATLKLSAVG